MPAYRYKAVSARGGEIRRGMIEAPSRDVAIARLQSAGHLPVSADEVASRPGFDAGRLSRWLQRDRVTQKDVALITRELATLLQANLPLDHALRVLSQFKLTPPTQRLLRHVLERIQGGASLSEALAAQAGVFSHLYVNLVRAGEASGALALAVGRLADYLERAAELRAYVVTALIYPAILLGFCVLSLVVLMVFVVPAFVPLFVDAGQTLPWLTQIVFALSALFQQYWWGLPVLVVCALWFASRCLTRPAYRLRFDAWCLRLPYVGEVIKQVDMARCARTLGTALANGVPLLTGIRLVKEVIGNRVIARAMDAVAASLEQGRSMAKPLKESGVCPHLAVQLIDVGEHSGQLESMLAKIADIYDKEVQTGIKRLLTVMEPALILGLGGLIAVIIVSVLLAVLSLNELVM